MKEPQKRRRSQVVDMSSEAIDRRLRTVSQLRRLGLSIRKAKYIGTVKELRERAAKDDGQDSHS